MARVVSPSGRTAQVRGFFDGDGEGGAVGRISRIVGGKVHTFQAPAPGDWVLYIYKQ